MEKYDRPKFMDIGRTAGSVSDYKYSKAMVAYAKEWSFEEMNSYLINHRLILKEQNGFCWT